MNDATAGGRMHARTLPSHDLKLIDGRRLVYEGALDLGGSVASRSTQRTAWASS